MSEDHPARALWDPLPVVFTAHSVRSAFMKQHICKFVFDSGRVPLNPFMNAEYFLLDTVPRDAVRRANNTYLRLSHEVWTFGAISDGVFEELRLAKALARPVRHFSLAKTLDSIHEIHPSELEYEPDVPPIETL